MKAVAQTSTHSHSSTQRLKPWKFLNLNLTLDPFPTRSAIIWSKEQPSIQGPQRFPQLPSRTNMEHRSTVSASAQLVKWANLSPYMHLLSTAGACVGMNSRTLMYSRSLLP